MAASRAVSPAAASASATWVNAHARRLAYSDCSSGGRGGPDDESNMAAAAAYWPPSSSAWPRSAVIDVGCRSTGGSLATPRRASSIAASRLPAYRRETTVHHEDPLRELAWCCIASD